MSGALSYLLITRFKNQIKSVLKSPGKLIYALILLGIIVTTVLTSGQSSKGLQPRDINELIAGVFVLYTVIFLLTARNGFSNGASMFTMPDVNLLFSSPVDPRSVLFFGLFQQLGTSLLMSVFMLFQYGWLHSLYAIRYSALLLMLLGFGVTVFCAHLTAMTIYSFTNSNEKRKRTVEVVFYGIIGVYVAGLVISLLSAQNMLDAQNTQLLTRLLSALGSGLIRTFPVSGWAATMVSGFVQGHVAPMAVGLGACALYIAAMAALLVAAKQEYYEDVLKTTEQSYSAITAKKSGMLGESVPKNVKVGRMGLQKGAGADAFYYKHLLENRRARVFLLSGNSLIFAACIIALSFFMKNVGVQAVFIASTYAQVISIALGRLTKELAKPFVYLVPEPAFKKLLACIKESYAGFVLEAVLIFVPVAFIMQLSAVETLCLIAARLSFSLLFTAGNVLVGRVFGTVSSKILTFFFYFASIIVVSIPGIVLAVVLVSTKILLISENVTILLSLALCNIPVALLVLFTCRNMLRYAELNNR